MSALLVELTVQDCITVVQLIDAQIKRVKRRTYFQTERDHLEALRGKVQNALDSVVFVKSS